MDDILNYIEEARRRTKSLILQLDYEIGDMEDSTKLTELANRKARILLCLKDTASSLDSAVDDLNHAIFETE